MDLLPGALLYHYDPATSVATQIYNGGRWVSPTMAPGDSLMVLLFLPAPMMRGVQRLLLTPTDGHSFNGSTAVVQLDVRCKTGYRCADARRP